MDGEWVEPQDIGPQLPLDEWPAWARQFADFSAIQPFKEEGWLLLRCRACDRALAIPPGYAPSQRPEPVLWWARHGLEHAAAGDLPWLRRRRNPTGGGGQGPATAGA